MTEEAGQATAEEREKIVELTRSIDRLMHGNRGDIAMSALMSCVVNLATQMPGALRPELGKDLRSIADTIDAMSDTEGEEAECRAMEFNKTAFRDEPVNEVAPAGTILQ